MRRYVRTFAIVSLLLTGMGAKSRFDGTFSGGLMEITVVSVAIRLDDGRIVQARNAKPRGELSPQALAARYNVGDRVQMVCNPTRSFYAPEIGQNLYLELKALKFLRESTAEDRALNLRSPFWVNTRNLLHAAAEQKVRSHQWQVQPRTAGAAGTAGWKARIERIRARVLASGSRMPNFTAHETVKHYSSKTDPPKWRLLDSVEAEITFKEGTESRTQILLNGKRWKSTWAALTVSKWSIAFGSGLYDIFKPNCGATFEPGGIVSEQGKSLSAIRFTSPADGCLHFNHGHQSYYAESSGRVLFDESEQDVLRLEQDSKDFPKGFPIGRSEQRISWGYIKIGDATYVLPVSGDWITVYPSGEMRLARIEYTNHRHFEAASSVTFH